MLMNQTWPNTTEWEKIQDNSTWQARAAVAHSNTLTWVLGQPWVLNSAKITTQSPNRKTGELNGVKVKERIRRSKQILKKYTEVLVDTKWWHIFFITVQKIQPLVCYWLMLEGLQFLKKYFLLYFCSFSRSVVFFLRNPWQHPVRETQHGTSLILRLSCYQWRFNNVSPDMTFTFL